MKDSDGDYIWRDGGAAKNNNGETQRLPNTLYGYPFYEQNDLPQSQLYFGDWSMYIIGDRQTMAVSTTTEGGDAWRKNAMERMIKKEIALTLSHSTRELFYKEL